MLHLKRSQQTIVLTPFLIGLINDRNFDLTNPRWVTTATTNAKKEEKRGLQNTKTTIKNHYTYTRLVLIYDGNPK